MSCTDPSCECRKTPYPTFAITNPTSSRPDWHEGIPVKVPQEDRIREIVREEIAAALAEKP